MSARTTVGRLLLTGWAAALAAGCEDGRSLVDDAEPDAFRITGVSVRPLDRIDANGATSYFLTDTLRGQLAFAVETEAEPVVPAPASRQSAAGVDEVPGMLVNPTLPERSWLSVDRPIVHRGVEIPAGTNLLEVEAIAESFDGSWVDLTFPPLSPFVLGQVHLRPIIFELPEGDYRFTFRWGSETEVFSDTVAVHVALKAGP